MWRFISQSFAFAGRQNKKGNIRMMFARHLFGSLGDGVEGPDRRVVMLSSCSLFEGVVELAKRTPVLRSKQLVELPPR
jgi:hypothetical protein